MNNLWVKVIKGICSNFWLSPPNGHPKASLSSQNSRLVFRNLRGNNSSLLLERLQNSPVNLIWLCEGWSVPIPSAMNT